MTPEKLSPRSPLYWLTTAMAGGIVFLGMRFLVAPRTGAAGFGTPTEDVGALPFMRAKGIRDIASGLVLLPLLMSASRRSVASVLAAESIIPITDGLIVLNTVGAKPALLAIHWGTAATMLAVALGLARTPRPRR